MVGQDDIKFFTEAGTTLRGAVFRIYVTHKIYKKWQVCFYPNPAVNLCRWTRIYYTSEEAAAELAVLTRLIPDSFVDLRGRPSENVLEEIELYRMLQQKGMNCRYSQKQSGRRNGLR